MSSFARASKPSGTTLALRKFAFLKLNLQQWQDDESPDTVTILVEPPGTGRSAEVKQYLPAVTGINYTDAIGEKQRGLVNAAPLEDCTEIPWRNLDSDAGVVSGGVGDRVIFPTDGCEFKPGIGVMSTRRGNGMTG